MPDKPRRWPLIAAAITIAAVTSFTAYAIHNGGTHNAITDFTHHIQEQGVELVIEHLLLDVVLHRLALAVEILLKLFEFIHWAVS